MKLIPTHIPDVKIIEPTVFGDARGFFMETWNSETLVSLGLNLTFVQDNHSRSGQGILRGLHYQLQQTQGKLVRVTTGAVFDVAVDLRQSSPTFGQWFGIELSADNHRMLWIPPGFAHGFYVLSESADFLYKCTEPYAPQYDRCLHWNDSTIGIQWPLVNGEMPQLSAKDAAGKYWHEADKFA
ncbi:MAG: dTDP-4-dehydrorhamnose 3,5-epimerase [Candidatus Thiothrix putei]|uniref:dTDP-4-dehydrorhamnose 3,5-epimerase n=1 Tax=Candidatus Thiothrix putei TaxID=3080811 RepID=A0AA95KK19_9GAMM|nr:MAG: dTDP-4-dehydrorhamnose 3,5-epimerase [Candidatus Thiothrix putei]